MGYRKNIASNFVTQIITSVLAFVVSIIVSRVLGAEGKGEVAYFLLFFTTIGQYGHFGITYATPYFSKKTKFSGEEVFNSNFSYIIFMCVIQSSLVIIAKSFGLIFKEYSYLTLFLGILILAFTMIAEFLSTVYIGNERIIEVNKITLASNIIKIALTIILWLAELLNIYTYLLVLSLPVIFNSILLMRKSKQKYKFEINKVLMSKEFKFGITIYLATLFIFMNYKIDQFFIKFMLGTTELGVYSVSVSLAELLFLIPGSVASAILGRLYNMKNDTPEERARLTSNTIKVTFYVTFLIMIIGILCTPIIPVLYGKQYTGAIVPTIILFVGILFASIGKISSSYFQSSGEPKVHLYITFSVFAINIVFNAVLIPLAGINGAAIASSISYFAYGIIYVIIFIRKEKFTFEGLFLFSDSDKEMIRQVKRRVLKR